MPRGKPQTCKCGRTHWSVGSDECPACRKVPASKQSHPRSRVLDHDLPISPSIIGIGGGRCLGGSREAVAGEKRCRVHWRRLSHRHCPTAGCGRAMASTAGLCGGCTALELLEPQVRELQALLFPEPKADPFPSIDHFTDRAHDVYLSDMLGLPVTVAL